MTDQGHTDTSDMLAVHGAFRSSLGDAPAVVDRVADGDVERAAVVANFYDNVLDFLHVHHSGEDDLIWPKLWARCPDQVAEVDRIASQHDDVVGLVDDARSTLARWAETGSSADALAVAGAMTALCDVLVPHLGEEEQVILPICSDHISPAEWAELPVHGFSHFGGDKPWIVLGLILDNMPEAHREFLVANMPPPAQAMWTGFGHQAYSSLATSLREG
jgi:hemerythrin-like domain-containing protein